MENIIKGKAEMVEQLSLLVFQKEIPFEQQMYTTKISKVALL
ncbi:hypothetical protein [Bacillus sp. OV322]|nr:hypothetical protein [Bacillus sp. OV322]